VIRVIVFDFDGVLAESAETKTRAFRELFADHPDHVEEIVALHEREAGRSRFWKFETIYRDILGRTLPDHENRALGEKFSALVLQAVLTCPLVPGAERFLRANAGRRALYVASGTPEEELRYIVEGRGLAQYFRGVYGSPRTKGEIVRSILADTGVRPEEVLFVGDARADQQGAREAGVFFLGRWPDRDTAPWAAARCLPDLETLEEAVTRFDRAVPVSVAICTCNGLTRGYLHEALASVAGQTVYPEEVLLVDDGSTDGTAEWVRQNHPDVRLLTQANAGLAAARNTAIRHTSCRYLAFLDDDDRWHPAKLEKQWQARARAVFTGLTLIDGQGRRVGQRRPLAGQVGWPEILLGNPVTGPSSVLLERALVHRVGDFRAGLGGTEDYDYWIRCSRVAPLRALEEELVEYRCHPGQMSAGYAAMAEKAMQVSEAHAHSGGDEFRKLVVRYNAYGVLGMGLDAVCRPPSAWAGAGPAKPPGACPYSRPAWQAWH